MDEIDPRPAEHLIDRVAKRRLERRIDNLEIPIKPGDAHHVGGHREEPVALFLGAFSAAEIDRFLEGLGFLKVWLNPTTGDGQQPAQRSVL